MRCTRPACSFQGCQGARLPIGRHALYFRWCRQVRFRFSGFFCFLLCFFKKWASEELWCSAPVRSAPGSLQPQVTSRTGNTRATPQPATSKRHLHHSCGGSKHAQWWHGGLFPCGPLGQTTNCFYPYCGTWVVCLSGPLEIACCVPPDLTEPHQTKSGPSNR